MISYVDFSIKIEPRRGDSYPVIVLKSPAGEGRSSFQLPFDPGDLGQLLTGLGNSVRSTGAVPVATLTSYDPQTVGDELYNALFSGSVRSLLDRSMGMIHGQEKGLRIKIHIDPGDPSLAPLSSLPWEFIYRKDTRDFLNLSRYTPVIRYLDVQRPYTPLPLDPPLRILVVMSEPEGYVGLDLERERALIENTWAQHHDVEVAFMEHATIAALQDRLTEEKWHVLHYMGHGGFDERTGQGVLVLEDQRRRSHLVDGGTLGVLLRDATSLRLVFLNACETARTGQQAGLDPFAGVASALVLTGVPAVVAMQFPITDEAAIQFTQRFYPLLARCYPVDAAAAEGRRAIRLASASSLEWGTPVVFMRAPDGQIFNVHSGGTPEPETNDEPLADELEIAYRAGLEALWNSDWDTAAVKLDRVASRDPGYRDVQRRLTEVRRQQGLAGRYGEALAAEERQDWQAASTAWAGLLAEAPDYRDVGLRQQRTSAALASAAAQTLTPPVAIAQTPPEAAPLATAGSRAAQRAPRKASRSCLTLVAGAIVLLATAAIIIWLSGNGAKKEPIARATGEAVAAPASAATRSVSTATRTPQTEHTMFAALDATSGLSDDAGQSAGVPVPTPTAPADTGLLTPSAPLVTTPSLDPTATPGEVPPTLTAPPVETPTPPATPTSSPTPTNLPTATPAQQPTVVATLAAPAVTAIGDTNLRDGPGTEFTVVGLLRAGDTLPITGRNPAGTWWQVATPQGGRAWITAERVIAAGQTNQVSVAAAPTSTAAPVATATLPARLAPGVLDDFENPSVWQRGDQPYGQLQRSTERARNGVAGGKLIYELPAVAANYVVLLPRPALALSGQPRGITAWVYGDGSGHFLNAWIQGSDGEVRSYTFGRVSHEGWQLMTALFDETAGWPNGHISGQDNGRLDFPASLYALVFDGVPDGVASRGVIYLDDLSALTP